MRCFAVLLLCCAAISLGAQTPSESTRVDSVAPPPPPPSAPVPPSPEQKRFLDGLKIATRGIAQFKDGMGRVTRAGKRDSVAQRRAGRFLAGLCGSGRAFLRRGRPQMNPTVYEDTVGVKAKRLVTQIDSLIAFTPTCEQRAAAAPDSTAGALGKRMKTYDTAWRDFRLAIGLPVKDDSAKAPRR